MVCFSYLISCCEFFVDFHDLHTFDANFVVEICALFPPIYLGWKTATANCFAFCMCGCQRNATNTSSLLEGSSGKAFVTFVLRIMPSVQLIANSCQLLPFCTMVKPSVCVCEWLEEFQSCRRGSRMVGVTYLFHLFSHHMLCSTGSTLEMKYLAKPSL